MIRALPLHAGLALVLLCLPGCGKDEPPPGPGPSVDVAEAHNAALGLMGMFEFEDAVPAFDKVVAAAPGLHQARVNLAIALLNTQDDMQLDRALAELAKVRAAQPGHPEASYVMALILLYRGKAAEALALFEPVAKEDPADAACAYWVGECLRNLDRFDEAAAWFRTSYTLDPYQQSAFYGAFQALMAAGRSAEAEPLLQEYERLQSNPLARLTQFKYTRMGLKGTARAGAVAKAPDPKPAPAGRLLAEQAVALELSGRKVTWSAEPGPAVTADFDGDDRQDLLLLAADGAAGTVARNVVLRGTAAGFEALAGHDLEPVTGASAALCGDLDNDGRVDVFFCRPEGNRLYMQRADGRFEDRTEVAKAGVGSRHTRDGLLADLDHDGDLDVFLLNRDGKNELLNNNLDGTFRPLGEQTGLGGNGKPSTGVTAIDLEGDRDLDLIVWKAGQAPEVFMNERLWSWKAAPGWFGKGAFLDQAPSVGVALDGDSDGTLEFYVSDLTHLGVVRQGRAGAWKLGAHWDLDPSGGAPDPLRTTGSVLSADLDGDGLLEVLCGRDGSLVGFSTRVLKREDESLYVVRNDGPGAWRHLLLLHHDVARGPCLLRVKPGAPPDLLVPATPRHGSLGLSFSGKHKEADSMRSNAAGLGLRVLVAVGERRGLIHHLRAQSGPGQSHQPLFVGLGGAPRLDYVELHWPDGLQQTEMLLQAGKVHRIEEVQRQTSSCPVLFCWDGTKHRFVTDILGVGGIGFWVGPDTYAPPLPREHVLLPEGLPVAKAGRYVLKLGEPMEETCYLDHADLAAWDLPPGWQLVLDERMGVLGPAPTSEPRFFRTERLPVKALATDGGDVTRSVLDADLKAAPVGPLDQRFLGRTQGSVLTLEFGAPIDVGAGAPLLVADGWVEYPYAQTLFAAWQAGAEYEAPTLEARGRDGTWVVVQEQFGYPAGMPRRMSFPLAGLPAGTTALRLSTTYEIYWDRIAVAYAEPCPEARRHVLPRVVARLDAAGFARRTAGPQRLPHYDWEKRVPLWDCRHQQGLYTALGDVEALLAVTDDALVVFGPGEEVHLEYRAALPPLPAGATRRFVLETSGWCKDSDLCTKDGDTVGPLPVREGVSDTRARDALHLTTRTRPGR